MSDQQSNNATDALAAHGLNLPSHSVVREDTRSNDANHEAGRLGAGGEEEGRRVDTTTPPPTAAVKFKDWERIRVVPGVNRETGANPHTWVETDLDLELQIYDLVEDLFSHLGNVYLGEDTSLFSEIIRAKFPDWQTKAAALELFRQDVESRRKIEEMPEGDWSVSRKNAERDILDKGIRKKKERIRKIWEMKTATDPEKAARSKAIADLGREFNLHVTGSDLENQLKVYIGGDVQHIFGNIDEVMKVYQYVEQAEKVVALQAGLDMTDGGKRSIEIFIPEQAIDEVAKKEIPAKWKQLVIELGKKVGLKDWPAVVQLLATANIGVAGGIEGMRGILSLLMSHGAVISIGGVDLTRFVQPAGFIGGAAAGVAAATLFRTLYRTIDHWMIKAPEPQAEKRTSFKLVLKEIGLPLGDSKDPIRRAYFRQGVKAGEFLGACESIRVRIAQQLQVHPGELEGWLNLSSTALGEGVNDLEITHRIALANNIEKILADEFRTESGQGYKKLEELNPEQQMEVIVRAFDTIALETGDTNLAAIIKTAATERIKKMATAGALGAETEGAARNRALTQLVADIRAGKANGVFHPKTGAMTVTEATAAVAQLTIVKDRQTATKNSYAAGIQRVDQLREAYERVQGESTTLQYTNGYLSERDPSTGKITGYKEEGGKILALTQEQSRISAERSRLYADIGYNEQTRTYTTDGLFNKYQTAKAKYEYEKRREEAIERQMSQAEARIRGLSPGDPEIAVKRAEISKCERDLIAQRANTLQAERGYTPLRELYEPKARRIEVITTKLEAIPTDMENLKSAVIDKEGTVDAAHITYLQETRRLKRVLLDLGYTETELSNPDFVIPALSTIEDKVKKTEAELQKKQAELTTMQERERQGLAVVSSDEDLEIAKWVEMIAPAYTAEQINYIQDAIYTGKISIEDLAKAGNDEGYRLLLTKIFGINALSAENYQVFSRLFSKARLAEAVMEIWHIHDRTASFFVGDNPGQQDYNDAQRIGQVNLGLQSQIQQLKRQKPPNWAEDLARLEAEYNANMATREAALDRLYKNRLAGLLGQNRVYTAAVVQKTMINLYQDAFNGFVEMPAETIAAVAQARQQVVPTSTGQVTITESARAIATGERSDRGSVRVDNINGLPGVTVEFTYPNVDPPAGLEVVLDIDLENGLDSIPDIPSALLPPELAIAYGPSNKRREVVDLGRLTQEAYDKMAYNTRLDARTAGVLGPILDLFYGTNDNNRKKSLEEIRRSSIDALHVGVLPVDRSAVGGGLDDSILDLFYYPDELHLRRRSDIDLHDLTNKTYNSLSLPWATRQTAEAAGLPTCLLDLFYGANPADRRKSLAEVREAVFDPKLLSYSYHLGVGFILPGKLRDFFYVPTDRRRTSREIRAYVESLPATRAGVIAGSINPAVIDWVYEAGPNGRRKGPADLGTLRISRDAASIATVKQLTSLVDAALSTHTSQRASDSLLQQVAEAYSNMGKITLEALLGNRFTGFTKGKFSVEHRDGEMKILFHDPRTNYDYETTLQEFIRNETYPAEVGAELQLSKTLKQRIIRQAGTNIINAVGKMPINRQVY
ncbi:hypothetical protein FJY90_02350 [Candidatus Gottesmanbacteria bacterium]|nr:hypothetical protein [Candidatus Gottesmanbacteria bacterium]